MTLDLKPKVNFEAKMKPNLGILGQTREFEAKSRPKLGILSQI
jgi:hypothetical protein